MRGKPGSVAMRLQRTLLVVSFAAATATIAAEETKLKVGPGPTTISQEERALTAPAAAVVLLDETSIDDSPGGTREVRRHVRAKILGNEGRELADVEIPMYTKGDRLIAFWGRTLLPDGRVLEIPLERVTYQRMSKGQGRFRFRYARAALPGVIPGAVIDFGYVLREDFVSLLERVDLQQRWPVRRLQIRWRPYSGDYATAWRIWSGDAVGAQVTQDGRTILVSVEDVPPFVREPWMPPDPQVRPSIALFYLDDTSEPNAFWGFQAAAEVERIETFLEDDASLAETIAGWKLPETMGLEARLEHAFRWVGEHVRNRQLASSEVLPDPAAVEGEERAARHVLAEGAGTSWEIGALFAGLAQKLGAQFVPVLAADRNRQVWDVQVAAPFRFDEVLIGVRTNGSLTLCAPGSGLQYGDVPWWVTGIPALIPGGIVQVPAAPASRNLHEVSATVALGNDGSAEISWTSRLAGQPGLDLRRQLRALQGAELQERLEALCGQPADVGAEVEQAEVEAVQRLGEDVKLRCSVRIPLADVVEEEGARTTVPVIGPWISPLPDFEGRASRVHPIVFPYPRLDMAKIEVAVPAGFVPGQEPIRPVTIDSPYGRYKLAVTRTEAGFTVERGYALTAIAVPAAEYAQLRSFLDAARRADRVALPLVRVAE